MMTRKSIAVGIAAALLGGVAIVSVSSDVTAASCQGGISSTWNTSKSTSGACGTRDGRSIGSNSGSFSQTLRAHCVSGGVHSFAFGVTLQSTDFAQCFSLDSACGDATQGPPDSTDCIAVLKHRPTIVF